MGEKEPYNGDFEYPQLTMKEQPTARFVMSTVPLQMELSTELH